MSNACPLNFIKVDSSVSRLNSLFVSLLVLSYLYTNNVYILIFLSFDFVLKLFINVEISPIMRLAESIKSTFKIKDKYTDGGAKKLAGYFGLFFVVSLLITHFIHSWMLTFGIAIVFLTCSLLDVFFNYCIGCKIYFIIKKIYPNFMNNL
ncbi:DUF4395 domain-containing protein [Sulfurimonas sp.]|uniref:DUF4395 domain-containing protein n=1 Tax=Sulfurimonas sp. TaxID=2022749 RepID=UPI00261E2FC9|nr:DUF4395 domain-containing protein [Sulfurimonas sp.]